MVDKWEFWQSGVAGVFQVSTEGVHLLDYANRYENVFFRYSPSFASCKRAAVAEEFNENRWVNFYLPLPTPYRVEDHRVSLKYMHIILEKKGNAYIHSVMPYVDGHQLGGVTTSSQNTFNAKLSRINQENTKDKLSLTFSGVKLSQEGLVWYVQLNLKGDATVSIHGGGAEFRE